MRKMDRIDKVLQSILEIYFGEKKHYQAERFPKKFYQEVDSV